jgi:prepilin-type processing-associated H-X9-DG protein
MSHKHNLVIVAVIMMTFVLSVSAETKFDPANCAETIAPYLDSQTLAVARVNVERINPDAIFEKVSEITLRHVESSEKDKMLSDLETPLQTVRQWITDFTTAGGKDIYIVMSLADFPKFFMIAPVVPDADTRTIAQLLRKVQPAGKSKSSPLYMNTFEKLDKVVFGGSDATLQRLREGEPDIRPELSTAFAAMGNSAVQVLIIPNADSRRVIEEMLPVLPAEVGGVPGTTITHGLMWAAVGIDGPPNMALKLRIQSQDATSAREIGRLIANLYNIIRQNTAIRKELHNLDEILKTLTPTVQRDHLTVALDKTGMDTIVNNVLSPATLQARQRAQQVVCMSQLRCIGTAIMLYQNDHRDKNPPNLETLIETAYIPAQSLICPASHDKYVYRGADLSSSTSSNMILVYDKLECHRGKYRNVLFADTHVERMTEDAFRKAIELDNKYRRKLKLPEKPH